MRIIIIFLAAAILSSCNEQNTKQTETGFVINGYSPLIIVEVDSCEYLYGAWAQATVLTHKGNCKYCVIRNHK